MEKMYRIQEAAEALGISVPTIYRWIKIGTLRTVSIKGVSRGKRIPESALRAVYEDAPHTAA